MNIFGCFRKKPLSNSDEQEYKAAGAFFTNSKLYLAGYQPHKCTPFISGIGGSKEAGETPTDTAIREAVEEIFDLIEIPNGMLDVIKLGINPGKIINNMSYVILVYSFEDLEYIIDVLNRYEVKSRSYDLIPISINELLMNRKVSTNKKTEVTHLCLLPLVSHSTRSSLVDVNLVKDISLILSSGT
jgi:hypothetical protein